MPPSALAYPRSIARRAAAVPLAAWVAAIASLCLGTPAQAQPGRAARAPVAAPAAPMPRCLDEDSDFNPAVEAPTPAAATPVAEPRQQLEALVGEALRRSQIVGATRLLAEAAQAEVEEARAGGQPTASASLFAGGTGSDTDETEATRGGQARASLNLNWTLYDAGRVDKLTQWRTQLAEASRLARLSAEEQIALQTVALALERNRHRLNTRVYQQYALKMACLVDAMEQIVAVDRGRASELVQARKQLLQADLARTQSVDAERQSELRLRRYVGEMPIVTEGLASLFTQVPELAAVQAEAERAAEIAQLGAQGDAARRLAEAVDAGHKAQLGFSVNASKAQGVGSPTSWTTGLTLTVPLLSPGEDASSTAAIKRAEALRAQREDALEARRARAADAHDQAGASLERARRTVEVLRESDRMRGFTLQQWRQLGRRSLFDVMSAESEHYGLRAAHVNALIDAQQANALLWSLGRGLSGWLQGAR